MAAGDLSLLKKCRAPIVALHTAGTTVRFILGNGNIQTFTISGATIAKLCHVNPDDARCFWTDNTYIYLGMRCGELRRITISGLANTKLAKFDSAINAIAVTGTTLYLGLDDGRFYSYALA